MSEAQNLLHHVEALFIEGGPFSRSLPHYAFRQEQMEMLRQVLHAYEEKAVALVEAGTGTGKSLAYLVPAILWAHFRKEKTVIATHTIHLQEQLLHKDIPLVAKALNISCSALVVKGMQNYLCLRKLDEAQIERLFLNESEQKEFDQIISWAAQTTEGTRSSLPIVPSPPIWEKVSAEHDTCTYQRCPHYKACHFFRAREKAKEANLLVVNHHLLFSDLSLRKDKGDFTSDALLPSYQRLVLDEAHHIEDVATLFLGQKLSRLDLFRTIGRIAAEKGKGSQGKLIQLRERLSKIPIASSPSLPPILKKMALEFPAQRQELLQALVDAFTHLSEYFTLLRRSDRNPTLQEEKIRMRKEYLSDTKWKNIVEPPVKHLITLLKNYARLLRHLDQDLRSALHQEVFEQTEGIRLELMALGKRLEAASDLLDHFLFNEPEPQVVRWIEKKNGQAI